MLLRPPLSHRLVATLVLLGGCGSSTSPSSDEPAPDGATPDAPVASPDGVDRTVGADTPEAHARSSSLVSLGGVPIGADGRSEPFSITMPSEHDVLGVHVSPTVPSERLDLCFQLEDVTNAAGDVWVPPADNASQWGRTCSDCTQRVLLTYGSGFYVFPNGPEPMAPGDVVSARVALRDCLSRLPVSEAVDGPLPVTVTVAWSSWQEVAADMPLTLPVHLVDTAGLLAEPGAELLLTDALDGATAHLSALGVVLTLVAETQLPTREELEVSIAEPGVLSEFITDAMVAPGHVPVVLTPCVRLTNAVFGESTEPDGFTLRIPGGYGGAGTPDAVYLRVSTCGGRAAPYWSSSDAMATVLVHEIGHYLGLHHTPDDHLPDTVSHGTIMDVNPLLQENPAFTPSQRRVLRRHPYLLPTSQGSSAAGM